MKKLWSVNFTFKSPNPRGSCEHADIFSGSINGMEILD